MFLSLIKLSAVCIVMELYICFFSYFTRLWCCVLCAFSSLFILMSRISMFNVLVLILYSFQQYFLHVPLIFLCHAM